MRNFRTLCASALALLFVGSTLAPTASAGFEGFYADSPDFGIESVNQTLNGYDYTIRVCNYGNTPSSQGSLEITVEKTGTDSENRVFAATAIAKGSCEDFVLDRVTRFGKYSERNYGVYVSVAWSGARNDSNSTNNRKYLAPFSLASGSTKTTNTTTTVSSGKNTIISDVFQNANNTTSYERGFYTNGNYPIYWNPVPNNRYVTGTTGYYWSVKSDAYSRESWYGQDRVNFFVPHIGIGSSDRTLVTTYCNDGVSMDSFKEMSIRIENRTGNRSFANTQTIRLLSGQCRDIEVSFDSLGVSFPGTYVFTATIDNQNNFAERFESDNVYSQTVTTNYSKNGTCYYRSGYYYQNGSAYSDSDCRYPVYSNSTNTIYNNSCYYSNGYYYTPNSSERYTNSSCTRTTNSCYYSNGYYLETNGNHRYVTESDCNRRVNPTSDVCYYSNGYYIDNSTGYQYSSAYNCQNRTNSTWTNYYNNSSYYNSCTYSGGYYYRNGYRYTDSLCQYPVSSNTYYYSNYYDTCTYYNGYYSQNGYYYTDNSCRNRSNNYDHDTHRNNNRSNSNNTWTPSMPEDYARYTGNDATTNNNRNIYTNQNTNRINSFNRCARSTSGYYSGVTGEYYQDSNCTIRKW